MSKLLFLPVFLIFSFSLLAQNDRAIGQWKLLLPYNSAISVTKGANKLYYASPYSVFSKDQTDGSVEYFDLVNALSDTDIRFIKYDKYSKKLFIIYQNSNIDVLVDDEVINIPVIKDKDFFGDKFIYDIYFKAGLAYMSCGFGMVALNTNSLEVNYSTFTEEAIRGISIVQDILYASISNGLFSIQQQDPSIQDIAAWHKVSITSLPNNFTAGLIGSLNNTLYFGMNNKLLSFDLVNEIVDTLFEEPIHQLVKLTQEEDGIVAVYKCDGPDLWDDCGGKVIFIPSGNSPSDTLQIIGDPAVNRPVDAIQDGKNIWMVDDWYPFRKINLEGGYVDAPKLNGPYSHRAFRTMVFDDTLYVAAGRWSPTKSYPVFPIADGLFYQDLKTQQWDFVNRAKYPFLSTQKADYNYLDFAIHPITRKKYIASLGGGIVTIDGEQIKVLNSTNSILKPSIGSSDGAEVVGLAFDKDNNLWATNTNTNEPLVVFKDDGSSLSFNLGASNRFSNRLLIDDFGNKWIIFVSKGLMVFSTGESLNDRSDDQYKLFNTANSEMQSNTVHDMAMDQDGFIWIGTDEGVVVFDCGGDVFGQYCKGNRRIASLDGFNAYLLADEKVNAVMVDPANRKWFGTTNGVFVLSPSGEEVLHTFNIANSPLPSNDIQSLSVNEKTGTVYIGTAFGLISYQSDAIKGGPLHKEDIYAYPNPVRPDYDGPIAIKGLAQNANVKITDIEGRLVFETEALGGQAIWNGRDYNHQKVESGVYLVFSTAQPGLSVDAAVAKIVVIK